MGCEGGVTIYDAEAIEAEFGADVWERTGFGKPHLNPRVELDGHMYLLGTFNTCSDQGGDRIDDIASEFRWRDEDERGAILARELERLAGKGWGAEWMWDLPDKGPEGLALVVTVACWAAEHAKVAERETWT